MTTLHRVITVRNDGTTHAIDVPEYDTANVLWSVGVAAKDTLYCGWLALSMDFGEPTWSVVNEGWPR